MGPGISAQCSCKLDDDAKTNAMHFHVKKTIFVDEASGLFMSIR